MSRHLIIQTAFIGDVILTTPFIRTLLEKDPRAEIHVVAVKAGADVLAGFERVTTHVLDKRSRAKGVKDLLSRLSWIEFDTVWCAHRSLRSLFIARRVRAKRRVSFDSVAARVLGFECVKYPPYREETHYSDKVMALLAVDGPVPPTPKPQLVSNLWERAPKQPYFVVSPFSVWGTKEWLPERFAEVAAELSREYGMIAILTGGHGAHEAEVSRAIRSRIHALGGTCEDFVGHTSLEELKALIRGARLVVSGDSAAVHIASAFDVPTTAVFGPTVKRFGFFPKSTKFEVVERMDVPCRPCSLHGPRVCPKKHFDCMMKVQSADVSAASRRILK